MEEQKFLIPGYQDYYITKSGKVYSFKRNKWTQLKPTKHRYPMVYLNNKNVAIHKLCILTFEGDKPEGLEINHINGKKDDASSKNLEYVTHSENMVHANETGLRKSSAKFVCQFDFEGNFIKEYSSVKEAAKESGANYKKIGTVCKGKRGSTGGFYWCYSKDRDTFVIPENRNIKTVFVYKDNVLINQFDKCVDAAKYYGINRKTLSYKLRLEKQVIPGLVFKYGPTKIKKIDSLLEEAKTWTRLKNHPQHTICKDGRVYSFALKQLVSTKIEEGYVLIKICTNYVQYDYRLHRLLAQTFIPNPNDYPIINHIDGNRSNNNLDNLEWCTFKQNAEHAIRTGLVKTKKIVEIEPDTGKIITIYNSSKELENELQVSNFVVRWAMKKKILCKDRFFQYYSEENN